MTPRLFGKRFWLPMLLVIAFASAAVAAPVMWLPNFPMRMPGAGVMGMWMPVPGATEYRVMRQIAGGEWTQVYKGPMTNFNDPAAPNDKDVSYKAIAVVGGKDEGETPIAVLKGEKPIMPPAGLTGRPEPANKTVSLRWNPAEGASFYNLYRAEKSGDAGTLLGSVQDMKYTDSNVADGNTYWYSLTSVSTTSQESKRGEELKIDVIFPKEEKVKTFDPVRREMEYVGESVGEEWGEFKGPYDFAIVGGQIYVICGDGVQVVDKDGTFVRRLPLLQEKVAAQEYSRPMRIYMTEKGTMFLTFINSPTVREFDARGEQLLRTITIPPHPLSGYPTQIGSITEGPDGRLWMVDLGHGNVLAVAADANGELKPEAVEWVGYPLGATDPFDAAKHGFRFVGPTVIRHLKLSGQLAVMQTTKANVAILDTKKKVIVNEVAGMGGGLHKFSGISDFREYDKESILTVDPLITQVRRIRVTKADDEKNGDYIESFVDDPAKEKLNIVNAGSISWAIYAPETKRLYILSALEARLLIYDVP